MVTKIESSKKPPKSTTITDLLDQIAADDRNGITNKASMSTTKECQLIIPKEKKNLLQRYIGRVSSLFKVNVVFCQEDATSHPSSAGTQYHGCRVKVFGLDADVVNKAQNYIQSMCMPDREVEEAYPPELDRELQKMQSKLEFDSQAFIAFTHKHSLKISGRADSVSAACRVVERQRNDFIQSVHQSLGVGGNHCAPPTFAPELESEGSGGRRGRAPPPPTRKRSAPTPPRRQPCLATSSSWATQRHRSGSRCAIWVEWARRSPRTRSWGC